MWPNGEYTIEAVCESMAQDEDGEWIYDPHESEAVCTTVTVRVGAVS